MKKKIKFLICVCTRNRKNQLNQFLKSLEKLKKPNNAHIRVFIIENQLKSKVTKNNLNFKNIDSYKLFLEKKIGISFARNRCLIEACKINFDYMVFFDDDCIVDKNWLIQNLSFMKKYNFDIVTGPHRSINNQYINILERRFKTGKSLNWASTNNVVLKKDILKKENLKFDLKIQKIGGEDQLYFMQLKRKGYKIIWNNSSIVYEKSLTNRNNFIWFLKRSFGYGCSSFFIYKKVFKKTYYIILTTAVLFNFLRMSGNAITLIISPKYSILKIFHFAFKILGIISVSIFSYKINRY